MAFETHVPINTHTYIVKVGPSVMDGLQNSDADVNTLADSGQWCFLAVVVHFCCRGFCLCCKDKMIRLSMARQITETSQTTFIIDLFYMWKIQKNNRFKSRFWPDKHRHHQKEFVKTNIAEHKQRTTKEAKHQPLPSANPILFARKNK